MSLPKFRKELVNKFNDSELKDICFDLGMDYEALPGESKLDRARELLQYLDRLGRLTELADQCATRRPNVPWKDFVAVPGADKPQATPASVAITVMSQSGEQLRSRSQLVPARELAQTASEIAFVGVSGISVLVNDLGFLEQKIKTGCKLRFILLDPNSPSVQTWNLLASVTTTERDICTALEYLKGLMQIKNARGKCEVRLSKVYPPYALLISDPNENTGVMNVEFYTYKTTFSDRPHVQLSRQQNQHWFDFFRGQFEQIWSDSEKWTPG
jgi:hypothetical protein